MYGITETTVHVTWRPITARDAESSSSPIGRAIPDLDVYVLDRQIQPVPVGVPGEIYVGGDGVARGYLRRPKLTAERFVPDPFGSTPGARLYRSGDLARVLPDGALEYLGRIDQQVQVRGFRVELGEIESALAGHGGVREALVIDRGGGEGARLVAYFVPSGQEVPTPGALFRHVRDRLPDYMIPAAFVSVDAFPLTGNGKLDRAALPDPPAVRPEVAAAYVEPEGALAGTIADVFGTLLGLDRVGLHDNFFDLGANSLVLVQVQRVLRKRLAREIPVTLLFRFPTVAALAAHLDGGSSDGPTRPADSIDDRVAKRRAARHRRRPRAP
jgi:acyl carrier protein